MVSIILQILLPFILSAFVVILIMYIAERFGSKIGGIVGTLPSTLVIALLFIASSKGPTLASDAALIVPVELAINILFLFVFSLLIHRSTSIAFLASFGIWTLFSLLLIVFSIKDAILSLILYLLTAIVLFIILEKIIQIPSSGSVHVHYTIKKIMLRGLLAGTIIAFAVFLSNFDIELSGVFSVFPAILSSTMLIAVREHGPIFAAGMAKSMIIGLSSVATYAVVVHYLYPSAGIVIGTIAAYLISVCVTIGIYEFRKKIR